MRRAHSAYWRILQLLAVVSLSLCIFSVYLGSWNHHDVLHSIPLPLDISKFRVPEFRFLKLSGPDVHDKISGAKNGEKASTFNPGREHPIDLLIRDAQRNFAKKIRDQEAHSLADAARKYRKRRKRHPPSGFEDWYHYAQQKGSVIVEEFFDSIYEDLAPFWGIGPAVLRATVSNADTVGARILIREGGKNISVEVQSETRQGDVKNGKSRRVEVWADMLRALGNEKHVVLPDVEILINEGDKPIVLPQWETVDTALQFAKPMMVDPQEVIDEVSSLSSSQSSQPPASGPLSSETSHNPTFLTSQLSAHPPSTRPLWSLIRPACPPYSPTRTSPLLADIWHTSGHTSIEHSAPFLLSANLPDHTLSGFVKIWKQSTDPCEFPGWQGLHGAFVEDFNRVTTTLLPIFGGEKIGGFRDIVMPGTGEWDREFNLTSKERKERGEDDQHKIATMQMAWEDKDNKLFWRGPATGGRHTEKTWMRFHRHRFVALTNATMVGMATNPRLVGDSVAVGTRGRPNERNGGSQDQTVSSSTDEHLEDEHSRRFLSPGGIFSLPISNPYQISALQTGWLAEWISSWSRVSFTDFKCDPLSFAPKVPDPDDKACKYTSALYSIVPSPTAFEAQKYKYTAVLDSDDGAGPELNDALRSGAVVLRASVFRTWSDQRLRPWIHYVPLDNTFTDLYGIMEYFLGGTATPVPITKPSPLRKLGIMGGSWKQDLESMKRPHDAEAAKIGERGRAWAEKVLRKEDMLVFVYRLVLEYARVLGDKRLREGWVGDLSNEGEE